MMNADNTPTDPEQSITMPSVLLPLIFEATSQAATVAEIKENVRLACFKFGIKNYRLLNGGQSPDADDILEMRAAIQEILVRIEGIVSRIAAGEPAMPPGANADKAFLEICRSENLPDIWRFVAARLQEATPTI